MPLTAEALRSLIFFAWSRKPSSINYTSAAQKVTMKKSEELSEKFGQCRDVPIVQESDFRKTLARICVAWAIIDGSFSSDYSGVIVLPEHVEDASEWIDANYSSSNCQLDRYSEKKKHSTEANVDEIKEYKRQVFEINPKRVVPRGHSFEKARLKVLFLHKMLQDEEVITSKEIQEVLCVDKTWVHKKLSMLKRNHLIEKVKFGYRQTPKMGKYLTNIFKDPKYQDLLDRMDVEDFQDEE
jgi:predicted transcriptional regulator